jgi:hypothetical protein
MACLSGVIATHAISKIEKEIGEVISKSGNIVSTGALASCGFWDIDVLITTQKGECRHATLLFSTVRNLRKTDFIMKIEDFSANRKGREYLNDPLTHSLVRSLNECF